MKLVYPDINHVFDTDIGKVNTIVIEHQKLLYSLCSDIVSQISGSDGKTVVSLDNEPLVFHRNVELLSQFIPFDINRKNLLSKLNSETEKIAISPEYYEQTMNEISALERYLIDITNELMGDIVYPKLSVSSIIKAAGLQFDSDYTSLGEALIDYMELVRQYDQDKLFVMVNLRTYISDEECRLFYDTLVRKALNVIIIEGSQHNSLANEELYIIDNDLCEIG